jgi:uncharacterized protein (DUF885 family)
MRRVSGYIAMACLAAACGDSTGENTSGQSTPAAEPAVTESAQTESERLNAWFEERYEEQLRFSPLQLTIQGRKDLYDQVDDMSEEAAERQLAWQRDTVRDMEREFDYEQLNDEAKASYDLWKIQYENAARDYEFRGNQYIFTQMGGPQSWIPTFMANFHRVDDKSDMEAYVARIGGASRALNQLIDRAQKNAEAGTRPPTFAYDGVLQQSRAIVTGAPFSEGEDSALWSDANSKIDALVEAGEISDEEANELREAAKTALLDELQPAYQRLISWVEEDRANATEGAVAANSLPDGEAYYAYRLADSTTTDLSAAEIHATGLAEVARIRNEMDAIRKEVGFEGDLQEFFDFVRDDERFYFPDTDEGREAYMDEVREKLAFIEERLPDYFGVLPKAGLIVKRVEPYREQDGAAQHYMQGTPDGSRPGIYYMHLSDMSAMPRPQLEVIAYHEGSPGHHMQISIAQELETVPTFRTQAGFGAYVEGWALYAELLALEMGAYEDPYSNFGRLSSEMWRALRLVVDTGLHSKGWSEEQAIEYMMENSPEPFESVQSEVRRYIVWPGQATSYKIGMLKILELRERAAEALGDSFDLRAFHDIVLKGGALPLSLLERRVDAWIAEQSAAA